MRKYIKDQLLALTETMSQAGIFITDWLERDEMADIISILEDEQQSALKISEIIERSEGKSNEVIRLLTEYYKLLWHCSQETNRNNQLEQCRKLVVFCKKIKKKIQEDIPVRYEAVFLPYKASMWDSLESIWLAAKEDPNCTSYVMPIPYYDRKPDHSFGSMHYEARLFPDCVPITSYQDYDLKNRHPEVIFIHNPYDENNYVTSIHPAFYSSTIKKYTNFLVYVPYYLSIDDVSELHCLQTGVLNADLVFVQSEKVRQTYIRTFKKALGYDENSAQTAGLYEKFLAFGSPKIDKVLNTKRTDIMLPEEWRAKIYGTIETHCEG